MSRKLLYIILFISGINYASSQVLVEGGIQFTSPVDSLRQISNVNRADSLSDAVTVNDQVNTRFLSTTNTTVTDSVFHVNSGLEIPFYTPGMLFYFHVPVLPDTVNVPRYININSLGTILLTSANLSQVNSTIVRSGRILCIIYNGTSFVVINQPALICPNGYKKMNENYCIQVNKNPKATFWNAQSNCYNQGAHLCYYNEWYYACVNNSGLLNIPVNFEWVNTTSNHNIHALKIGASGNCKNTDSETTATTGLPQFYRCCYKLK